MKIFKIFSILIFLLSASQIFALAPKSFPITRENAYLQKIEIIREALSSGKNSLFTKAIKSLSKDFSVFQFNTQGDIEAASTAMRGTIAEAPFFRINTREARIRCFHFISSFINWVEASFPGLTQRKIDSNELYPEIDMLSIPFILFENARQHWNDISKDSNSSQVICIFGVEKGITYFTIITVSDYDIHSALQSKENGGKRGKGTERGEALSVWIPVILNKTQEIKKMYEIGFDFDVVLTSKKQSYSYQKKEYNKTEWDKGSSSTFIIRHSHKKESKKRVLKISG